MNQGAGDRLEPLFAQGDREEIVAVAHQAAQPAVLADLPLDLAPAVRQALATQRITQLYDHQRRAFDLLTQHSNIVVSTGTASGKSLCFALPALHTFAQDDQAKALFLYPTKALAQDQVRKIALLRVPGAVPAIYDGDTPQQQRRQVRQRATILLSNPDMLHLGILPAHERWAEFLHHLRYVVLDEAHVYRGVLRLARRPGRAPPATSLRRIRVRPPFCARLGDDRQPP